MSSVMEAAVVLVPGDKKFGSVAEKEVLQIDVAEKDLLAAAFRNC